MKWTVGKGFPDDTKIKVKIKGAFKAKNSKSTYTEALMARVNNDSAVPDERTWEQAGFSSGSGAKCPDSPTISTSSAGRAITSRMR